MNPIQNYIGGKLTPPVSLAYLDNFEPATGQVYSRTPDSDERDVMLAVAAAQSAFESWSSTPAAERAEMLSRMASAIDSRAEDLARAESIDNGKPVSVARTVDVPRAASNFRFYAAAAVTFASESHDMDGSGFNYTLRQPIGICGCISPWNLPLYLFTWKIAPALAAGNCVVAKPSEVTPMTAFLLSEICCDAGLPAGVLNVVHGAGPKVGAAIVAHDQVRAITFTGSTRTGAEIAKVAAPRFKKLSLEMGGKNPNIIFSDCNYGEMLATTIRSSFSNQGQICLCGSRIFVQDTIYERFKRDFVERAVALKIGDPLSDETDLGAVVSEAHQEKILSYLKLAQAEGGNLLCGGRAIDLTERCAAGWFVAPAVIEGLPNTCRTNREEIFGPVVTLQRFKTEEEVLAAANDSDYGLSATIWTENLNRAHRLSKKLKTGIVWVNCWMLRDLRTPFGGMKDSGVGREGGFEAMRFFTEPRNICIRTL